MFQKEGVGAEEVGRSGMAPAEDPILGSVAKNLASGRTILSTNAQMPSTLTNLRF